MKYIQSLIFECKEEGNEVMLHSLNFVELGTFRPSIDVQSYDVYS